MAAEELRELALNLGGLATHDPIAPGALAGDVPRFMDLYDRVADPTALKAIATLGFLTGKTRVAEVLSLVAFFYFSPTSSATPDDITVIQPTVGAGRWLIWPGGGSQIPRVTNIAAMVALSTVGFASTSAHLVETQTVRDFWKFDPSTVIPTWLNATNFGLGDLSFDGVSTFISIQAANTNHPTSDRAWWMPSMERVSNAAQTGSWVRMLIPDHRWQARQGNATTQHWGLDPAGTFATPGDDEADGSLTAPLRNVAEWRRRTRGANYTLNCYIKALSGTQLEDNGNFDGPFTYISSFLVLYGDETVVFSGTLTNYVAQAAPNTRGQIVAASLPGGTWTAAGGVSGSTASRYFRTTAGTTHAPILKDLGGTTAQIGMPTDTSTDPTAAVSATITAISPTATFDVTSRLQWPFMRSGRFSNLRALCLDLKSTTSAITGFQCQTSLCGVLSSGFIGSVIGPRHFNTVFLGAVTSTGEIPTLFNCSFLNSQVQFGTQGLTGNWNTLTNVFVGSNLQLIHGGYLAEGGTLAFYDSTITNGCLMVEHGSVAERVALIGAGNTEKLLNCLFGANIFLGGNTVATGMTSFALPIAVDGVNFSLAALQQGAIKNKDTGCGIYP